jgi:hypothetical protein
MTSAGCKQSELNMVKKQTTRIFQGNNQTPLWITLLLAGQLALSACGIKANSHPEEPLPEIPDISINGGGDEHSPVGYDTPIPPPDDTCDANGPITITPAQSINFGPSETGHQECVDVTVTPPCVAVEAEIADTDAESDGEFVIKVGGAESSGRVSNIEGGTFKVCYKRLTETSETNPIVSHSGKLNVLVGDGSHISVILLSGETHFPLITLTNIENESVVWEGSHGEPKTDGWDKERIYQNYFPVNVKGHVNMELAEAFKKRKMIVAVKEGGITQVAEFADDGSFEITIEIPTAIKTYPVFFTLDTATEDSTKGEITKKINILRYTAPIIRLEIRDEDGKLISAKGENLIKRITDDRRLTAGITVTNIDYSGPWQADETHSEDYSVALSLNIESGSSIDLGHATSNFPKNQPFYKNFDFSNFEDNKCEGGFEEDTESQATFCVPITEASAFNLGINKLTARACNQYTTYKNMHQCVETDVYFVVDNDLPEIFIDSPTENELFANDNSEVTLSFTIKNFQMHEMVTNSETDKEEPVCAVKLWVNKSIEASANETISYIPLCEEFLKGNNNITIIDGAEPDKTTGHFGNTREASFSIQVGPDGVEVAEGLGNNHRLTLYTNIIRIEAQDAKGHKVYKSTSFRRGQLKQREVLTKFEKKNLQTGQLGIIKDGHVSQAPIMLNISEGFLKNKDGTLRKNMVRIIEKLLNDPEDGLKLENLVENYFPEDDGSIPESVKPNSHLLGVPKVMKWVENGQQNFNFDTDVKNACGFDEPENTRFASCAAILFPHTLNHPLLFGETLNQTNIWSPVVFGKRNKNGELLDVNNNVIPTNLTTGWPLNPDDKSRIAPDYNFKNIKQGPVTVDKFDMGDDGHISAQITIHGFKGNAFAFSMCEQGPATFPVIPFIFNIKELRLKLDNIWLKKIQLDENGNEYELNELDIRGNPIPENRPCTGGKCANKLIIYPEDIRIDQPNQADQNIVMIADKCEEIYVENHDQPKLPHGCSEDNDPEENFWLIFETRNYMGKHDKLHEGEAGRDLLNKLQEVLRQAFVDMLTCDVPIQVNSLLDNNAFEAPDYLSGPDNNMIERALDDLEIELTDEIKLKLDLNDGKMTAELSTKTDGQFKHAFDLNIDLKNSDLLINDTNMTVKFPFNMKAMDINHYPPEKGHLYREPEHIYSFDAQYPLPSDPAKQSLTASIALEELIHAGGYIILHKGIGTLLDMLDVDEFEYPTGYKEKNNIDDWTLPLDKVIFGRLDICGAMGGQLLKTSLDSGILFPNVEHLFETKDNHWDIKIDPAHPPTLAILSREDQPTNPYGAFDETDEDTNIKTSYEGTDATLQLGLSNVEVTIKNLYNDETNYKLWKIGEEVVMKLRLDALIKIDVRYNEANRDLELFIHPLDQTPLYLSVLEAQGIFDHSEVTSTFWTEVIGAAFSKISADNSKRPSFVLRLPRDISAFNDNEMYKSYSEVEGIDDEIVLLNLTSLGDNGECEGATDDEIEANKPKYADHTDGDLQVILQPMPITVTPIDPNVWAGGDIQGPPKSKFQCALEAFDSSCKLAQAAQDNEIIESLCDVGIEEISFENESPHLMFDATNGYLHLDASLLLKVYDEIDQIFSSTEDEWSHECDF